jgi:tRNA pseudouridine55 synthase
VSCSKGTYIRTLAEDIGEVLGCGAHLAALRRTRCGALALADAVTIEQLEQMGPAAREACLLPVDRLLAAWPEVDLALAEAERFLRGQPRAIEVPDAPALRVYCVAGGRRSFVGSARAAQGRLLPVRLLSAEESAALGAHEPRDRQTCSPGEGHP